MPASMGREHTDMPRVARSVTTGGDSRPPRAIRRPLVVIIADQASALMSEPEWLTGDRNSITVATTDRLRVTLMALQPDAEIGSKTIDDTIVVQTLRGQVRLDVNGMEVALGPGQLTTIEEPGPWQITAETEALLLVTAAHADGVGDSDG
jgi:quercetin dioxygenase-like cupin family protein